MSFGRKWKNWKEELKRTTYGLHDNDEDRLANCPNRVDPDQGRVRVQFWGTPTYSLVKPTMKAYVRKWDTRVGGRAIVMMLVGADGFSDRAEANISPDSPEFASFGSKGGLGIEDFQIIGEAKPGYRLLGCGFPVRGASLCPFQWVYHLRDGTRQYIEGAINPEYVVAADDMDKLIAVECIPLDDRSLQVAASPNGDGNGDAGEITHSLPEHNG